MNADEIFSPGFRKAVQHVLTEKQIREAELRAQQTAVDLSDSDPEDFDCRR